MIADNRLTDGFADKMRKLEGPPLNSLLASKALPSVLRNGCYGAQIRPLPDTILSITVGASNMTASLYGAVSTSRYIITHVYSSTWDWPASI